MVKPVFKTTKPKAAPAGYSVEFQAGGESHGLQPANLPSGHPVGVLVNEEMAIRRALEKSSGSRVLASRELGIDRTTLWRKMRRYGIDYPSRRSGHERVG